MFPGEPLRSGDYIVAISGVSRDPIDDEKAARDIVAAVKFK
jgi:hypothetical protein